MGNNLCAPWKKPYIEDDHWTPRKDSHLLRLWAEIFEVQEANGDIRWSRVSDDVVPVNITCIQNHPSTVFHITAYNRHVEKIFDVRLVQPGTRITQASECFAHWKDSKCDHEWGLNFTTPLDARRFHDCCMGSSKQSWRKAASSASLGLSPPQKVQCRKASSNPTSPVAHSRPVSSALDEFLVEDAIEAGFLFPGRDKLLDELPADISSESVRQKTCQLACENIYTRLSHNLASCTSNNLMNNSLAEREVCNTLVTTNRYDWPPETSRSDFGAGKCNEENCVLRHKPPISNQELRQFSREPSTLSICKMKNYDHFSIDGDDGQCTLRETQSNFKMPTYRNTLKNNADDANCTYEPCGIYAETMREQAGFDSNTLKRLLQTFPNSVQQANAQECPISKSLSASCQMTFKHHISHRKTQIMEAYLGNDGKMLQQRDVDIKLQQQLNNNLDMTMERRGSDLNVSENETPFSDEKVNEDFPDIDILPYRLQQPFSSRSTAIRKTGFLFVQNWLLNKIVTVVLSPQQSWRQYWTCLKGTALLLYDFENSDQNQKHPTHVLVISGCLAHPHSEHTGCEYTFSISTIFGWAYLFKTSSKAEMSSWIQNIHLACAASFARHLGKKSTMKLLSNEIHKLENSIDLDLKMKKMASMQIHTVNDPVNRDILNRQIVSWDENLEKLFVEQYQLRCYLSALQSSELPCAQMLLSNISEATKASFNVLTPVACHTVVCARLPVTATESFSHFPKNQDHCLLSTFKADNSNKLLHKAPRTINLQSRNCCDNVDVVEDFTSTNDQVGQALGNVLLSIRLPRNQTMVVEMNDKTTVEDLLTRVCNRCHLNSSTHFLRVKGNDNELHRIPDNTDLVLLEEGETLEVCAKVLFQAEIFRNRKERDFGFSIEARSSGDSKQDLSVYISDIGKGIITGSKKGLHVGDELIVLNSLMVSELDMVYIETTLEECESVSLTVRSCRSVDQLCEIQKEHAEELDFLQPSTKLWQKNELHEINRGDDHQFSSLKDEYSTNSLCTSDLQLLLQDEDSNNAMKTGSFMNSLNDRQQCREVIVELIETERDYVKDLNCLIESYLEPLKTGTFLPDAVIERLFGNIKEIVKFQEIFLRSMEDAVNDDGLSQEYNNDCFPMKKSLFSLGSAFLYYAHHFKLYSSFCASHSKAKKILLSENISFQEFLRFQNVHHRQSASLESYLVKPIQRFLQYTQMLRRLVDLTNQQSDEWAHLKALHGMEAVAEHINEMQKIYEEYGGILDEMMKDYRDKHPQANDVDLNVGELQMYGTVNWLNALDEICKVNTEMELLTLLFIFKCGVVLVAQECFKRKRKAEHGRPSLRGETIESACLQIFIPVEQLQVRTMVGDAYECHGVWEMLQCRSEIDDQSEKVFQFASSREARRDFIRTIQQTILHSVNRISVAAHDRKELVDVLPCHYSKIDHKTAHHNSPTILERPESSLVDPMTESPLSFPNRDESVVFKDNCLCQQSGNCIDGTEFTDSVCKVQSDNEAILGSQSTLASERAGARLVHASHHPKACSNKSESADPIGSPIWKPRHVAKHLETVKLRTPSEDEYIEHHTVENKQKVAFRIPHNKGTDC